jgi:uncharacterized repeat protein (TIGR03803 family)
MSCSKAPGGGFNDRKRCHITRNIARAVFLFCVAIVVASPAQTTFKSLASLGGTTGEYPLYMSLIQGADGSFYGTSSYGGGVNGGGTIFRITPAGALTIVYSFCAESFCADGGAPYSGLVQAADGSFYGTTFYGGAYYDGEVFKVTPEGRLTVLHSFNRSDGANPIAPVIQARDGNLYGTTSGGGASGYGTVFKITRGGSFTVLHSFNGDDGALPYAGLVQGTDGMLYGTTFGGGTGGGTVFKITLHGSLTTLYIFNGEPNASPYGGLLQAADGNFYGTTEGGPQSEGTVFKITPRGELTTLHNFAGYPFEGADPYAGLVQAPDGNFYGTTEKGGANDGTGCGGYSCGTVFEITPQGEMTTLYSFCTQSGCSDGYAPYGGLLQGTDGTFYGTTFRGGTSGDCNNGFGYGCGTVFSLGVGLSPFVSLVRNPAKVGQVFGVLGQGFIGSTSVSLNGIPASFTVKSSTLLEATVPVGATTGYVTVTTPSSTLTSNVPFHVIR